MNVRLILLLVSPVLAYHSNDHMFVVRRGPANYLASPASRHATSYSSPLIIRSPAMESEHHPLQLSSSLRHVIREPHAELTAGSHLPSSLSRLLMKPHHMEDLQSKQPAYYYVASTPTRHKEPPPYLRGRNFPAIAQALRPPGSKFLPTAFKTDYLMEDEIPLSMAEDASFPIYSVHKKPLVHRTRPHIYDDYDQSSEQSSSPLLVHPRPYTHNRSPLVMRSMESPRRHHFHMPMFDHEYQRPRSMWGHRGDEDDVQEGQYDEQLEGGVEEEEMKSQQNAEKKKRRKRKKKKKKQQDLSRTKKTDEEWMSVPEVGTSEEVNGKGGAVDEFARRSSKSDEVDWGHLEQEDILRVDRHANSTDSKRY